jgi:enoyl-CoA hydratase/carnithine racemase
MTDSTALKTQVSPPIGWLLIDRPQTRGAMTKAMWEELPGTLAWLSAQEGVRVLVVRGTGGHFIAGADIGEFDKLRSDPELARLYDEGSSATLDALERLSVPSIAMVTGPCIGGGCLVAFGCDLRLASEDAYFGIPAGKLGLAYPPRGLERLVAVIGEAGALDMLMTGRFIKGAEAADMGIVHRAVVADELEQATRSLCSQIAENAPLALRYARLAVRRRAPGVIGADEQRELISACFASDDYKEGLAAFAEKRRPRFRGR